jgi:hypothetical protein
MAPGNFRLRGNSGRSYPVAYGPQHRLVRRSAMAASEGEADKASMASFGLLTQSGQSGGPICRAAQRSLNGMLGVPLRLAGSTR